MSVYTDNAQRLADPIGAPIRGGYAHDSRTLNPQGPLPVFAALSWLADALGDLDSAIGALACRIEPVLSPTSPTTLASDERPSPGPAPVTTAINDHANRVSRLTTAVREISNRLEI